MNLASLFLLAPWLFLSGPAIDARTQPESALTPPLLCDGDIMPPRPVVRVAAEYPNSLKGSGRHGIVVLRARLSKEGKVGGIEVIEASFPEFVPHAIRAFRNFRYKPARLCDEPVEVYMTQTFNFRQ